MALLMKSMAALQEMTLSREIILLMDRDPKRALARARRVITLVDRKIASDTAAVSTVH